MKKIFFYLTFLLLSISCTQKKQVKKLSIAKELFTLYKRNNTVVNVARATTINQNIKVDYYKIYIGETENNKQHFLKDTIVKSQDLKGLKLSSSNYNWTPYKRKNILFIQIKPKRQENEFNLLDLKGDLEDEISSELEKEQQGEWMASDIGPGGANILFTVDDIDSAFTTILSVITARHIEENTIIARRVMTKQDDWFYEVLYPAHFTGQFNTM